MTGAQDQKFTILCSWFARGQDGYLTSDDFLGMADLFTSLPGGEEPENAEPVREAFAKWWQLLLDSGDADADGRIGRQEFLDLMKSNVATPGNFEEAVLRIADAFIRIVDTSGDGSLAFDEYVRMYAGLGIDPKHSTDAFRRLDRDQDGRISEDEFRTAITEFYLSDDPDAPGNWLLGPMAQPA
ncbi:MAG: calcium-binding protein [Saccharothrix sp.]|nr:calcium-binding protein [Saccharothrix sp.]